MDIVSDQQSKKIHPYKFTLWVALASILMMFAGMTSAYIVKSNQAGWHDVVMPKIFWISTVAILCSSLTMQMTLRSFKQRAMQQYRLLLATTFILGIVFIVFQCIGFLHLWNQQHVTLKGSGAGQFLYVIFGLHVVHVLGGVIALMIIFFKEFFGRVKVFSAAPLEVATTYWHFVDALWIYLLIFFLWVG
ncbi:MAG: cytochrome c oxidase subunit 3 [Bacteroidetes bacterium]|nr:cytochrome c oxidase subunit 3 [Bacteroidota bacterium]MBS1633110.1 cytochrome c oxidase subunit 3 [Bacteroidota bacterium]